MDTKDSSILVLTTDWRPVVGERGEEGRGRRERGRGEEGGGRYKTMISPVVPMLDQ